MKQITGQWQLPNGVPVAGGRLFLRLSQDAVAIGSNQVAPALVPITLDSGGSIPAGTQIWANDELTPSGTTYTVSVLAAGGGMVYGPESFNFTGTSPLNINNAQPTTQNVMLGTPVLQNPSSTQTITGFDLNLSSANLGISSGNTIKWNSDTGLSRGAAGVLDVGNGGQGDTSGTIKANTVIGLSATSGSNSAIVAQANTNTNVTFNVLNGATDQKMWDYVANSTAFFGRAINDAASSANNWIQVNRGAGFTISSVQIPTALSAQSYIGKLCVGSGSCYANVAAAVAAAGSTNKTIIEIQSAPGYAGTDCGANQANIIYLDYRGMNPPCNTNNSVLLNPSTSAVTQMAMEVIMNSPSPAAGTAVTSTQFSTFVTGTLPGAGGLIDGTAATAFTTGALSGTLGVLRGAEIASSVNGTGGAVTIAEGAAFYVAGSNGTTTTIGTARGAQFAGCSGQTYGTAPGICSGADFNSQGGIGSSGNFAARFFDVALFNNGIQFNNSTWAASGSGNAIPTGQVAKTLQKSESAADTNVLTFTQPAINAVYRVSFTLSLSAANAATLGWSCSWTDANGNFQNPTNQPLFQSGTAAPALTFTTSATGAYYGSVIVDTNAGANNIVVKLTFSGTSFTGKVSAAVERIV